MVGQDDEAVEVEELGLSHEFAICCGQDGCGEKQSAWDTGDDVDYKPVVVKCVFSLLSMIPRRPILALRNPTQTNESVLDYAVCNAGLNRFPYGDGSCLDERSKRHPQTCFAA